MTGPRKITRREALRRLGLGAAAAYVAPSVMGLSAARASTPSPASAASAPSAPSGPSRARGGLSAPSSPGTCRLPRDSGNITISQRDYTRAQKAISQGRAMPLREVLQKVAKTEPGRPVQVGYTEDGARALYRVLIVKPSGQVRSLTIDAGSGLILSAGNC